MVLDRRQILEQAEHARARGNTRKALKRYRQLLVLNPADAGIHAKIAPLLARCNELAEAQKSFVYAARDLWQKGFLDRALGLYREAVHWLPRDASLWEAISELHRLRSRNVDAIDALIEGAGHLDHRGGRQQGILLLKRALELEPDHLKASIAMAKHLAGAGRHAEARSLFESLIPRAHGKALREIRAALVWLSPTPSAIWRWLRAVFRGI